MTMSDVLIELVYRLDQANKDVCAADCQHNPLICDTSPGYCHCNIGLTLQAANDVPCIIDRET